MKNALLNERLEGFQEGFQEAQRLRNYGDRDDGMGYGCIMVLAAIAFLIIILWAQ